MAQVIQNPFYKEQKELASQQPSRSTRKCLNLREPVRKLCYIATFLSAMALCFVVGTKMTETCFQWTPYALCVANRHCAYLRKNELDSYLDFLPFVQEGGRCVSRSEYQDMISKGLEKTIDYFNNWLTPQNNVGQSEGSLIDRVKEIVTPRNLKEQKRQLLSQFNYYYDEEVIMRLTRYEVGLWLIFMICFFLRKLFDSENCGRRKTVFDFMRPSSSSSTTSQPTNQGPKVEITQEQVRKARELALAMKKKL